MFKPCAIGLDESDRTSEGYQLPQKGILLAQKGFILQLSKNMIY